MCRIHAEAELGSSQTPATRGDLMFLIHKPSSLDHPTPCFAYATATEKRVAFTHSEYSRKALLALNNKVVC